MHKTTMTEDQREAKGKRPIPQKIRRKRSQAKFGQYAPNAPTPAKQDQELLNIFAHYNTIE